MKPKPKKRIRPPDDPHRSEPRSRRKRPGHEVMMAPETWEAIDEHVERRGESRSTFLERAALEQVRRES